MTTFVGADTCEDAFSLQDMDTLRGFERVNIACPKTTLLDALHQLENEFLLKT